MARARSPVPRPRPDNAPPPRHRDPRPGVAIINTSPDAINLLSTVFNHAGFRVVSAYTFDIRDGNLNLESFLRTHEPGVVVYDIAPPYEQNFELLEQLRRTSLKGYRLVLTTTNPSRVEPLVGRDEQVYEVVDKEGDLDMIIRATREALRARSTRS